jgi:xanthine dehydrogenase small subunit
MATAHLNGNTGFDDALAGNLCRCTGYAPIIRAAEAAASEPTPPWLRDTPPPLSGPEISAEGHGSAMREAGSPPPAAMSPQSADELAALYVRYPEATLVAGATDVGLWVTKQLRTPEQMIFLNRCRDLQDIRITDSDIHIGAGVTMDRVLDMISDHHPSYAEMIRRYGSGQVRAAATIGGNIANGSPIGDNPPALIALGATVFLRQGDIRREMLLEDFYIAYGKQDRLPGEFVEAVSIPRQDDHLKVYKLSKRFDQDISAVCGAFSIRHKDGIVTSARIAFGGMAGIPQRAHHVETALTGTPWTAESLRKTHEVWEQDFTPLSDMRASATYRLSSARNMLLRYFHDSQGTQSSVLEVTP